MTNETPAPKRISVLERDLKVVLDQLDDFQVKVEAADNSPEATAYLQEELEKILLNLDDFQQKIEQADEEEIGALKGMLGDLKDKLMLNDESSSDRKKRVRRGSTPEQHLELYLSHTRARKGTHDLPQAILLQNVINRQQENSNWFTSLLFGENKHQRSSRRGSGLIEKGVENGGNLKASESANAQLKETVSRLEEQIALMELSYRQELTAHQEVIQTLNRKNVQLADKVYELTATQSDYEQMEKDIATYQEIILQLQKDNVQLHYKIDVLSSSVDGDDPFEEDPAYLSSSLEDSLSQSPSLKEMTQRTSQTSNAVPFSQRVLNVIHHN